MLLFVKLYFYTFLLCTTAISLSQEQLTTICVIPDSTSCKDIKENRSTIDDYLPPYCQRCYSLSKFNDVAQEITSYSTIIFLNGTFELPFQVKFQNLMDITLENENSDAYAIINCPNIEGGMIFENVTYLTIAGLSFQNCETHVYLNGVSDIRGDLFCSLAFLYGSTLNLSQVEITNASTALCILNVQNVTLKYINVYHAASRIERAESGNIIAYNQDKHEYRGYSELLIEMSIFSSSGHGLSKCNNHNTSKSAGGLALFLKSPFVSVCVKDTYFDSNYGCSGGSMLLYLSSINALQIPTVTFKNVTFYNSHASIGGGAYISFEETFYRVPDGSKIMPHSVALNISNCTFENNFAALDGGGLYVQWKESISNHTSHVYDAIITDCVFKGNQIGDTGSGGLAIHFRTYVESQEEPYLLDRVRVNLYFKGCNLSDHKPPSSRSKKQELESSVILAKSVPYLNLDSVNVSYNNCTAILAIGSTLLFSGDSVVSHNTALTGAGLRLCSDSLLYFKPHTNLLITHNSAFTVGGGVLVNSKCLVNEPMCFFQFTKTVIHHHALLNTINVTITENCANITGNNIYGGSLDYCYLLYVKTKYNDLFKSHLNITPNSNDPCSISSDPQQVCFVPPIHGCNKEGNTSIIYPGQNIELTMKLVGQMNGSVLGIVTMYHYEGITAYKYDVTKHILKYDGQKAQYKILSDTKKVNVSRIINLFFEVDNAGLSTTQHSRQFSPAVYNVRFKECPLGFTMQIANMSDIEKVGYACTFSRTYFSLISNYSLGTIDDPTVYITKDIGSWIGSEGKAQFYEAKYCPLDYCSSSYNRITVISDTSFEQDSQCQYNRKGIMCGSCKQNMSLVLGNNECRECSNVFLLLIIPFAIAGLVLVFLISCLDLTITTGSVNGLIFYANVIQLNSIQFFTKHQVHLLSPILRLFIAWLNLDVGIPVCFFNGMTAFTKTLLQGVFPIYLWIIASVIIILSHRYVQITRLVGQNAIKVLATLILLSYTKMLQVTIGALNTSSLRVYDKANDKVYYKIRWIRDGNIPYFDFHSHMILASLSIIFVLVSLPFTLCLLCIKYSYSLSNHWKMFSIINKLKPFFDAYTGPFKDNSRFWPGLLLVVRVGLLTSRILINTKFNPFYYAVTIFSLALLAFMTIFHGVYKSRIMNVLESTFIFNLGFIFINKIVFTDQNDPKHSIRKVVVNISLSIAFLTFLGIVAWHIYLKVAKNKHLLRMIGRFRRVDNFDRQTVQGMRGYEPLEESSDAVDYKTSSDRMVSFPPTMNNSHMVSSLGN